MSRAGFTLVEMMVALVIAGLAVTTAAGIFGASADAVAAMDARSHEWMREGNAHRWLSHVLAGMDVQNTPDGSFDGGPRELRFRSRAWVPAGWLEVGQTTIRYELGRLVATSPDGNRIVLADSLEDAAFDFLLRHGADSPWLAEWRSGATAPLAVRLRLQRPDQQADTVLYFVRERR